MRKVLSFVLVLSLVLGSFSMAFAASNFSDVVGTDYEDAVNVLVDLDVVTGYDDGTYKPADIVNRAEMAVLVVKAMGMEAYITDNTNSSFSDMSGYGWAEGYISYAQGMGVVSGYPDGTFRPGNTVSYEEAATMLVAALGYTNASLNGTWPANFVSQARALGILEGISASSAGANRGDVAIMIYQTLDSKIGSVNTDGQWVANANNDTMLKRLGAEEKNNGEAFVLTAADADTSVINVRAYVGAYIKAYTNTDGDIIAINEVKSDFLNGKVNSDNKFKAGGVEYTIVGADYNDGTTNGAIYMENGEVKLFVEEVKDSTGDVTTEEQAKVETLANLTSLGTVTIAANVSGRTIKDVYSVNKWDGAERFMFDNDYAAEIKDDQELAGKEFPLDDYNEIDETGFALLGVNSLDDIKTDNVVYVYSDSSDTITRVEVGTEVVTGTLSRIRNGSDFTIGGTTYEEADETAKGDDVSAGDEVKLYLDYSGDYYKVEAISGSANDYAIVITSRHGSDDGLDPAVIQLFMADGTWKTFDVDEESSSVRSYVNTNAQWTDQPANGAIVKYGIDKNGYVDALDVPTPKTVESDDITSRGYYDGKSINTNAVIFTLDLDNDETLADVNSGSVTVKTGNLDVSSYSKITGLDKVNATYITKDNNIVAMLINSDATSDDDIYGVIVEWGEDDNDAGGSVEFLIAGQRSSVTYDARSTTVINDLDNNPNKYKNGIFKLNFNASGAVSSLTWVDNTVTVTNTTVFRGGTEDGATYSSSDKTITFNDPSTGKPSEAAADTYSYDSENINVFKLDGDDWKRGSLSDLNKFDNIDLYDCIDEDRVVDTILVY